ncbi:thiamine diphosphokinase [Pseudophaeobacter arcticus]|uniref:thiamine diphosphokinase n=1 Tax=Pseudophaeobacter arcticus TaxID=385492 RepID=UPI003A97C4E1
MNKLIVDETRPVALVGGGDLGEGDLNWALSLTGCLVAADGGACHALALNQLPSAVIGDFDSISPQTLAQIPPDRLFRVAEQDSTDFEKALRAIRAPLVVAVGFLGGRVDHQLAVLNALVQDIGPPCLLLGAHEVVFHLPARISLPLLAGETVSLFPLREVRAQSTGLEWPLEGLVMRPGGQIGTSNRALGPVTLSSDGPGLLGLVPRHHLPALIRALL